MLGYPELLRACQQVVAGVNYQVQFTAPINCIGADQDQTRVGRVEAVAVVYFPLPFMAMGAPAAPTVTSIDVAVLLDEH